MSAVSGTMTAAQLATLADSDDGRRCELVKGVLQMMSPAGHEHGRIAMRLGSLLDQHVREHGLGVVYAAETGFLLARNPDTVRAPDVAFVEDSRLRALGDAAGYLPLAPDLVGEVVSPRDTFSQVEEKTLCWLKAGTRMVLVVDPGTRTVQVYQSSDQVVVSEETATLEAQDVVAGWAVPIAELFR